MVFKHKIVIYVCSLINLISTGYFFSAHVDFIALEFSCKIIKVHFDISLLFRTCSSSAFLPSFVISIFVFFVL